jgi:hypothetical protein
LSSPNDRATRDARAKGFWNRHGDRILGASVLFILTIGTLVYWVIEDWSLLDSFYFSSIALTAVGFGDLTPSTDVSKIFTVFYIFTGVAVVGVWLNYRLKRRTKKVARRQGFGLDRDSEDAPPESRDHSAGEG